MFMCAGDGPGFGQGGDPEGRIGPAEPGGYYVDGRLGGAREVGTDTRRLLVAMDLTTHKVAWRRLLDERCGGTITTAGGLIFAGRYNGELTALDSDTGQRLWSFQTDGGFTTTATTFEHRGTQYLVGLAGGSITGGRPNDGLWLFSLNGQMESLPPGSGDLQTSDAGIPGQGNQDPFDMARRQLRDSFDYERTADLARGAQIYQTVCQACHGPNGEGGHEAGAPLTAGLSAFDIVARATAGVAGTAMASFSGSYSVEELQDVANFILQDVLQ
jgi:mono/diheme cytochrome c family protein